MAKKCKMHFSFVFFVTIYSCITVAPATEQTANFYLGPKCEEDTLVLTFTNKSNSIPREYMNKIDSFKMNGLWTLMFVGGAEPGNTKLSDTIMTESAKQIGVCVKKQDVIGKRNATRVYFSKVERIGPPDLTDKELLLYILDDLTGPSDKVTGNVPEFWGDSSAYAFFGKGSWLLYPKTSYQGKPVCLQHNNKENQDGDTFTYKMNVKDLVVRSIKLDVNGACDS